MSTVQSLTAKAVICFAMGAASCAGADPSGHAAETSAAGAHLQNLAMADTVSLVITPAGVLYRAALTEKELDKVGCLYRSAAGGRAAVLAMLDILREGITKSNDSAAPTIDVHIKIVFGRGEESLGKFLFADNHGGKHEVQGIFPSGWGLGAADLPARVRAWAQRDDVRKMETGASGC